MYISRIYKQQMMITIVDALQRTRIEKACQLLLETDWPVADIAMQTGFASTSYFHRMFKRALGVTPTDYRRSRPISV
ncbi:Arabinose operon regulatory protein [compost metagenome]